MKSVRAGRRRRPATAAPPRGAAEPSGDRLTPLRRRVDVLDRRIVRLLGARQRLVASMKPFKSRLRDVRRESAILKSVVRQARRAGADQTFVREVYLALLGASRSLQKRAR